jgi:hypothetical protein
MDVKLQMTIEIDQLHRRIDKIEQLRNEEALTLIEILSNITFFGELKKAKCEHAKNGQCRFFILMTEAKGKIPIAADCRINLCKVDEPHCHIELSNITCALCEIDKDEIKVSKIKRTKKNQTNNHQKKTRNRN